MSREQKIPQGRLSRLSKVSKTALKIAGQHALHKATTSVTSKETAVQKRTAHYEAIAKEIFTTLSGLKGTALKAAQLLSLELDLLPEPIQKELQKSCYQVPSLNYAVVRKVIHSQLGSPPEKLFASFDRNAFAAASIGQVHRAVLQNGKSVAVKIQYPGIDATLRHDLDLLHVLLQRLPIPKIKEKRTLISTLLSECRDRFLEETDYVQERAYMTFFRDTNPFETIVIPNPTPELCAKTVLTMTFLEGHHLSEWLDRHPSQHEKNQYAQQLWDFFAYFFKHHHILHADPNPGNYLVMKDGRLGILDFGCVKRCDPDFPEKLCQVIEHHLNKDIEPVMRLYTEWGLLPPKLQQNPKQVAQHLAFFRDWLTLPFQHDVFDFAKHPDYMACRFSDRYKDALHVLHNTTHNFVMFDRAYIGLLNVFQKLNAKVAISFDR